MKLTSVSEFGPLTWTLALICDPSTLSGRRDSNPRPLVTNRSRPMLVIGCQKWALTCQDGLDQ